MGIYKLPKNQWTKDGRKYKYYWNEKDKSGKWKKKFSQAYKTKLDAMNAEREFLNNKVERVKYIVYGIFIYIKSHYRYFIF